MSKKFSKTQIKRNRKAWLEALRSGKFRQARGQLKSRNGSYCCLGVLCEVAEVPKVYEYGEYQYGDTNSSDYRAASSTSLPLQAMEWLGVTHDTPRLAQPVLIKDKYGDEHEEDNLIELNDTYKWSFEQIADAVEKYGLAE